MGADRSNAGQRILNSKRTIRGAEEALENYIGHSLQDGCQCFVIEEQSNYRFLAASKLPADGKHIVAPHTTPQNGPGRWVRESGLAGFALLESGTLKEGRFRDYKYQMLVQFEMKGSELRYLGTVPRAALFFGTSEEQVNVVLLQGELPRIVAGGKRGDQGAAGCAILHPGDRVVMCSDACESPPRAGALQVILT